MSTSTQSDPTVWEHYNQQAKIEDIDLRKDWDTSMDVLLIFAALFSAILTAFVVDTYHKLELGDTQILLAISAQLADPRKEPISAEAFTPDPKDVVVNVMFFSSLGCSLITAMGAMLVKQWMRNYARGLEEMDEPRRRALARHRRFVETLRWRLPDLVALLPVIMQLALGLFFAGLGILLFHNTVIFGVIISLSGLGATVLFITALISTLFPDAPFRTPVSRFIRWLFITPVLARFSDHSAEETGGVRNNASPNDPVADWEALEWLAKRTSPTPENSGRVYAIITAAGESHGRWKDMEGKAHWETLVDYVLDSPPEASQDRGSPLRALFLAFVGTHLSSFNAVDSLERTMDALSRPGSSVEDCWLMYYYRYSSPARFFSNARNSPPPQVTGTSPAEGLQHLRELFICLFPAPFFKRSDLDSLLCEYFVTPGSDETLLTIVNSKPVTQTKRFRLAAYIMRSWPNKESSDARGTFHRGLLHLLLATAWLDFPPISFQEPFPSGDTNSKSLSAVLNGPPSSEQAEVLEGPNLHSYLVALRLCVSGLGEIKGDLRVDLLHALASVVTRCSLEDTNRVLHIFYPLMPKLNYESGRVVEMLIATINSWEFEVQLKCYAIFMLAIYARRHNQIDAAERHIWKLKQKGSRAIICLLLDIPFEKLPVPMDMPTIDDPLWQAPELMLEMNRRFDDMERSASELSFGRYDSLFLRAALWHPSASTSFYRKALRCLARVTSRQHTEDIPITEILSTMVIDEWLGTGDSLSILMDIAHLGAAKPVFLRVCMAWNWRDLSDSFPRNTALKWVSYLAELPILLAVSEINGILASPLFQLDSAFDAVMVSTIFLKLKLENADAIQNSHCFHHLKTFWKDGESEDPANFEAIAIMSARKWLRDRTALDGAGIREAWEWIAEIARRGLVLERIFQDLWISPVLCNILPQPTSDIEGLGPLISATVKADTGLARALTSQDGLDWLRSVSQEGGHRDWSADMLSWVVECEHGRLRRQDAKRLIALSKEIYGKFKLSAEEIDHWLRMVRMIDNHHHEVVLESHVMQDMLDHVRSLSPATDDPTSALRATNIQEITDKKDQSTRALSKLQRFMAMTKFDKFIALLSSPASEVSPV